MSSPCANQSTKVPVTYNSALFPDIICDPIRIAPNLGITHANDLQSDYTHLSVSLLVF